MSAGEETLLLGSCKHMLLIKDADSHLNGKIFAGTERFSETTEYVSKESKVKVHQTPGRHDSPSPSPKRGRNQELEAQVGWGEGSEPSGV